MIRWFQKRLSRVGAILTLILLILGFIFIHQARGGNSSWSLDACQAMIKFSIVSEPTSTPVFSCHNWPKTEGELLTATLNCGKDQIMARVNTAANTDPSFTKGVYLAASITCGQALGDPPSIIQCGGFTYTVNLMKGDFTCHEPMV